MPVVGCPSTQTITASGVPTFGHGRRWVFRRNSGKVRSQWQVRSFPLGSGGSAAARRGAVGAGSGVPRCGQEGGQEGSGGGVLGPVGADHPSARPAAGLGRGGPHRHPAPHLAGPRRTTDDDAAPDALRRLAAGRLRSCLATPRRHDTTDTTDRHARRRRGARRRCGARRPTPCGAPARGSGSGGGPRYEKAGESSPTSRPGARCPPGRSGPTSGPPPRARGP